MHSQSHIKTANVFRVSWKTAPVDFFRLFASPNVVHQQWDVARERKGLEHSRDICWPYYEHNARRTVIGRNPWRKFY